MFLFYISSDFQGFVVCFKVGRSAYLAYLSYVPHPPPPPPSDDPDPFMGTNAAY